MINQIVAQPSNFIIDPQRDAVDNALWKAATGTPAVSGGKFRFNTAQGVARVNCLYGLFDFSVNFPTTGIQTPTNLTDDLAFGLKNLSLGNLSKIDVFIDQSGDSITFRTYDEFGTVQSTVLTWDTDWNSAQTIFRIGWSKNGVSLSVLTNGATSFTALATHSTSIPNRPLDIFVQAVGADNFDLDFIALKNVQSSSILLI